MRQLSVSFRTVCGDSLHMGRPHLTEGFNSTYRVLKWLAEVRDALRKTNPTRLVTTTRGPAAPLPQLADSYIPGQSATAHEIESCFLWVCEAIESTRQS